MVPVHFRGFTTIVEPNRPTFTKDEVEAHGKKAMMAKRMSEKRKIDLLFSSDNDDEDDVEEIDELSQSILKPIRSCPSIHKKEEVNYIGIYNMLVF